MEVISPLSIYSRILRYFHSAKKLLLFSLLSIPFVQFSHAKSAISLIAVIPRDLEKQCFHSAFFGQLTAIKNLKHPASG